MKKNTYLFSLAFIGILFFIFGFITWINSVLIPFLKQVCDLSDYQAYFVTFAFYISYFVMAIPSSWVLRKIGFVRGMSVGLLIMAIGSFCFIPAAQTANYFLFLIGLFIQGTGLALLQTASNPYVVILGPMENAAQRISIMGICNKVAGIIGILFLSMVLFQDTEVLAKQSELAIGIEKQALLHTLAQRIIMPYQIIGAVFIVLAVAVIFAKLPNIQPQQESGNTAASRKSIFQYPYLWLGALSLFLYVGAEVVAIDTLALYGQYQGLLAEQASKLGTYSLIALSIGYLLGIVCIPKKISQRKALIICGILGILFLSGALLFKGIISIAFIVLLSFAHALMWPGIWPLSLDKLGKHTEKASAILIMAIVGGALLPLLYGAFADYLGGNRQLPYLILFPCYLFILFFAFKGHRVGKR